MKYFVADAFTDALFGGNPAGVCLLAAPLDTALMQQIAAENNLAETAFLLRRDDGDYDLRWFTPEVEIDLCGHGTLASAFVLHDIVRTNADIYRFHTKSGLLTVTPRGDLYEMDFPARPPRPVEITPQMRAALGCHILEAHRSRDLLLLLESEAAVRDLRPDFAALAALPESFGIIVTAADDSGGFVSRFFAPGAGIPEDPVTGSAHATLIPFWAARLGENRLTARQLSKRGGTLYCENCGARVKIAGRAALYLAGEIHII